MPDARDAVSFSEEQRVALREYGRKWAAAFFAEGDARKRAWAQAFERERRYIASMSPPALAADIAMPVTLASLKALEGGIGIHGAKK